MPKSLRRTVGRHYDVLVASGAGVAERWRAQYPKGERNLAGGRSAGDIQNQLDALSEDAPPERFDEAIGNQGWTHPTCKCCGEYVKRAVSVGEYGSVELCEPCLEFLLKECREAR